MSRGAKGLAVIDGQREPFPIQAGALIIRSRASLSWGLALSNTASMPIRYADSEDRCHVEL